MEVDIHIEVFLFLFERVLLHQILLYHYNDKSLSSPLREISSPWGAPPSRLRWIVTEGPSNSVDEFGDSLEVLVIEILVEMVVVMVVVVVVVMASVVVEAHLSEVAVKCELLKIVLNRSHRPNC